MKVDIYDYVKNGRLDELNKIIKEQKAICKKEAEEEAKEKARKEAREEALSEKRTAAIDAIKAYLECLVDRPLKDEEISVYIDDFKTLEKHYDSANKLFKKLSKDSNFIDIALW